MKRGDRVELIRMGEDPHPLERGTRGTAEETDVWWPIVKCPKPVIGAIDGPAIGMGVEFTSQCGEIGNLTPDRVAVLIGNDINSDAGLISSIGKPHQLAYLVDREAKIAGTTNEGQAAQVRTLIGPIVPRRSRRCRQQANLLIVADRLDLGAGRTGQFSDRQFLRHSA